MAASAGRCHLPYPPWLAAATAFLAALAPNWLNCTELIHVKLKVRDLFSSIIMMTALYSINLHSRRAALLTLDRKSPALSQQRGSRACPAAVLIIAVYRDGAQILLDAFLKTRAGFFCARQATTKTWSRRWRDEAI